MPFFKSLRAQLPSRHRRNSSGNKREAASNKQSATSSTTSSLKSNGSSIYHQNHHRHHHQQENSSSNKDHNEYNDYQHQGSVIVYNGKNDNAVPLIATQNYYNNNNNNSNNNNNNNNNNNSDNHNDAMMQHQYNNYSSSRASIISGSNYADVPMYFTRQQLPQQQHQYRIAKPNVQPPPPSDMLYQQQQQQIQQPPRRDASKLEFYCQLAHGSPTALISGFASLKELYEKIAERFEIGPEDILFCTLNTHKINMTELVGGQIGLDDFVFAHTKGRPKEIELIKTDSALGLTLTDNGTGYVFIKRISANSIMDRLGDVVGVGDHIEKINGRSVVGKRHYEVARLLKNIEQGACLLLRLVEPMSRTGFGVIGPRHAGPRSRSKFACYGTGRETLRFRADGYARIELVYEDERTREQIDKINNALELYMGIYDSVLARRLWEIAQNKINSMDLAKAIECSMPDAYDFPDDFIFEVWRIAFKARTAR